MRLAVGERKRWARYSGGSGATTLTFAYTVKKADADEDGVGIKKNSVKLNGGSIADSDGNAAKLKHPALPDQSGHRVNGEPPARSEPVEPPAEPEPARQILQEPEPTPTPAPIPERKAQEPEPQPQEITDNTPPTYSIAAFSRYDPVMERTNSY